MAIILDTDGFVSKTYSNYLEENLFSALANMSPKKQFVATGGTDNQYLTLNVEGRALPRQKGLFHSKKTEKWLQQSGASVFISLKRTLKVSSFLQQVLIITNEEQLNEEKIITSATAIGLVSQGLNLLFNKKYPALVTKSFLLEGIVTAAEPANNDDMRELVASGREYFILADFNLTQEKLTSLLKGFSVFKRMLHSSWKLMLVLRSEETISRVDVEKLLSNYKYREDIIITDDSQLPEKLRDAYCLVTVDNSERFPIPIIEAARVGTPAITTVTNSVKHIFDDSVAYVAENSSEAIGDMLMKVYKEENFRKALIGKLKSRNIPGLNGALKVLIQALPE